MYLERLSVRNFRNCSQAELHFCPQFNVLVGDNGMGKTNLLDAVHYLCLSKSHFASINDAAALQSGADFFRLEGDFVLAQQSPLQIVCKYSPSGKKAMECNRQAYERLADHIGRLPAVMVAPDDGQLLEEGSENRRQLIDFTLSQLDARYLEQLALYNRYLRQRNALLKQQSPGAPIDLDILGYYDQQMAPLAHYVHEQRSRQTLPLQTHFQGYYAALSGGRETVGLHYESNLSEADFLECMRNARPRDLTLQRSTQGIHRDDWTLSIEGNSPLRRYASQGQRKSYLLALRLAQYALLNDQGPSGNPPLLLLDDVFDKLDAERMRNLLTLLAGKNFGQVFLSDTRPERLAVLLDELGIAYKLFFVERGRVR